MQLHARGAKAWPVTPYRYASDADTADVVKTIHRLADGDVDLVVFTATPQVERLLEVSRASGLETKLAAGLARTPIAAIGPVVEATLSLHGLTAALRPESSFTSSRLCAPFVPGGRRDERTAPNRGNPKILNPHTGDRRIMRRIKAALLALIISPAFYCPATAQSVTDFIASGKPIVDLRARYEGVSDASKTLDASARTLRARLGYETVPGMVCNLRPNWMKYWQLAVRPTTARATARSPILSSPTPR